MRPDHVIFNRVAVAQDFGLLAARHLTDELVLHIFGKRRADAIAIDFIGVQRFGFKVDVVAGTVREPDHLVLNAGTVARARGLDLTVVHGGAVEIVAISSWIRSLVCVI